MKRKTTLLLISTSSSLIIGLWLGAWYVGIQGGLINTITTQPLADVFSSVNALFAGFAFCGVILTVYLQIQELQDTRNVLAETAKANTRTADYAKESAVIELFRTYCSEYFQGVKDSSMNVLIPAMASRSYFNFVISRFFVADQLTLEENAWQRVSLVSRYQSFEEFKKSEQFDRYKLDELLNFFTILAYQNDSSDIIARCDFSYSWWRPMFWMLALAQEINYSTNEKIRKYGTKLYFKDVVERLDIAYGFEPLKEAKDLIALIQGHPKLVEHYQLDPEHLDIKLWRNV